MGTRASRPLFSPFPLGKSASRTVRELAPWFIPSALVHVGLVALWLAQPGKPVRTERPLPDWAIVLVSPVAEAPPVDLPPSPTPLEAPPPLETKVVMPSTPGEIAVTLPPPTLPSPDGFVGPAERSIAARTPGPITFGPMYRSAELLRPQRHDRRLYTVLPPDIVGLSEAQIAELDLKLMIADIADSVEVMAEAGRRATDWTYTDSKGRRWGVSPGQVHLGDITIPLPFGFSVPVTADAARRAYQDADIAMHADRAAAQAILKDRAAEIRRRRDTERAQQRSRADSAAAQSPRDPDPVLR